MKNIKSMIVIAIIAAAAGIVVWHLMWMVEIERKVRTGQPSITSAISEAKEKKKKNQSVTAEKNRPAAGEAVESVQKSRAQAIQSEEGLPERVKPVETRVAPAAGPSSGGTNPKSEKDAGKWFEKDISLGKKDQSVMSDTEKTGTQRTNEKKMSVPVINNKPNPPMQRIIPQPPPVPGLQPGMPYPTSTEP